MHQSILAAALAVIAVPCAAADLDAILAENHEAHGGDAYEAVEAVRARLLIKEPDFQVEGVYVATRKGRMRIDIYADGKRVYAEGLMARPAGGSDDPEDVCAWEWNPGTTEEETPQCAGEAETAALRHGIETPGHFYTLKDVRERGASVELIGKAEGEGGPEWQIRVTLPDGFSRDYFVDQARHRITRVRDQRAFHPGIDATEITVETRAYDVYFVDGVLRARRQESYNVETGEWLNTTHVLTAEHNPPIAEGMFEPSWQAPSSPRP